MTDNHNCQSAPDPSEHFRTSLPHPMFDRPEPPDEFDCLDAIHRSVSAITLCKHLDLSSDSCGEPTRRAISGYRRLLEMTGNTLLYTAKRLATLSRKQRKKARKKHRHLSALLASLSTLGGDDRDGVLNAMAARLRMTRIDVDALIDRATAE